MSNQRKRILVTGSNGLLGSMLMEAWRNSPVYQGIGLARTPGSNTDVVVDLQDLDALTEACQGIDAIVHLGASSAVGSTWDAVLHSNLIGTYNLFEAARRAGVELVVYASSNHAVGTFETANVPSLWDLEDPRQIDHTAEIQPDSLYGVSKVFGEALARYYVDHHGMRSVCLRIGAARSPQDPSHPNLLWDPARNEEDAIDQQRRRMRAVWLSERDFVQLVEKSLETDRRWVVCYGISDNPRKVWDIDHAREVLGYQPQDAAPTEILPGRLD